MSIIGLGSSATIARRRAESGTTNRALKSSGWAATTLELTTTRSRRRL